MKRHTRRPMFSVTESLEVRQNLSAQTVFVLDFTPDYRSMGSLQTTFENVRFGNGRVPEMFDFDGNGRLTGNDVTVAANQITARVRSYFASYLGTTGLSIISGDINSSSNQLLGDRWLRYGLQSSNVAVNVMYFGGRSAGGEYGRAPLAAEGYNVEGFGEVYVRSIAIDLINRSPRTTPAEFAISVASTTAHELGHMMGLRHATSGPATNIMVPGRGRANNSFPNVAVATEGGRAQNPHHELWYSLKGQPTYYQVVSYGLPDGPVDHSHEHEHEHEIEFENERELTHLDDEQSAGIIVDDSWYAVQHTQTEVEPVSPGDVTTTSGPSPVSPSGSLLDDFFAHDYELPIEVEWKMVSLRMATPDGNNSRPRAHADQSAHPTPVPGPMFRVTEFERNAVQQAAMASQVGLMDRAVNPLPGAGDAIALDEVHASVS